MVPGSPQMIGPVDTVTGAPPRVTRRSARAAQWIHAFSVDNIAVKVADPLFVGQCAARRAEVGNKVVWKARADEKVGVVARRRGRPAVIEYSEIDPEARALARVHEALHELLGRLPLAYLHCPHHPDADGGDAGENAARLLHLRQRSSAGRRRRSRK